MSAITQFVKNTAYQSFNDFFLRVIAAVTGIIVIRFMPREAYGLLALVMAIVGFLNLISNLGYPTMIIKSISQFYPSDAAKAASYYRFIFKIYGVIAVVVATALFFSAPLIADFYDIGPDAWIVRIAALWFFLMCLYSLQNWTFVGLNQIKPFFLKVGIPKELFTLLLVIMFLYFGYDVEGVIFAQILGLAAALILSLRIIFEKLKGHSDEIDKKWIVRGALELTPSKLAYASTVYMDVMIIGAILTAPFLASYRACLAVVMIIYGLFPVGTFIMPTFHKLTRERAVCLLNDILKCTLMFALPAMVFLAVFSAQIIKILFGSQYLDSVGLLALFSLALAGQFIESIFVGVMNYLGRFKCMSKIWAVMAVLNVLLLVVLTKLFGVKGAVMATVCLHYLLALSMGYDVSKQGMPLQIKSLLLIVLAGLPLLVNFLGVGHLNLWIKSILYVASFAIYVVVLKVMGVFSNLEMLKEVSLFSTPTIENKSV